jgi:hypothetical protein
MAVPAALTPLAGIPLNPVRAPVPEPPPTTEAVVEVLGRLVQDLQTPSEQLVQTGAPSEETLHSLRLLALDNLVEIVRLREEVAERDTTIVALRLDVESWQQRAQTLSEARAAEKLAAHHRERELVTVLHQALTENEVMQGELAWRRKPWWRRGRRPQAAVTPAQLLGSAAR